MNRPDIDETTIRQELHDIALQNQQLAAAGEYAAAIMHEINSPLEAVTNLNYLIQQEADDPDRVMEYSTLIDEQLALIGKLSRQTLSFYRSRETREAIAISTLAEAALRVHQRRISAKQIKLQRRFPPDVTAEVHAGDILQVISNLIGNAIDALPDKGTLGISVRRRADEVQVTVADNGSGIPPGTLGRIFDPFFTTKKERGTGLGLAISKSIIEKHHGHIKSRSTTRPLRTGTAFRISIPLAGAAAL